jgi:polyhydroxybutyrate depolymerase
LYLSITTVWAFSDIETNWYKDSIIWLKEQGIINGYEDGGYHPENTVSRAEVLKIIMNSADLEVTKPEAKCFPDVSVSSWQAKYVCSWVESWITKWYEDSTFRPGNDVTILETVTFAVRAFDIDLSYLWEWLEWYHKYQGFAHEKNIVPKHAYTIDTYASRWEAANIIYRIQQYAKGVKLNYNSSACGISSNMKSWEYSLTINGNIREYLLYVPAGTSNNSPKKLIVAFHGRTNSNEMVRDYMKLWGGGYWSTKNQKDFIVAYPAGSWAWPYGWHQYENIEFFDALVTEISENLCIDRDAVFSVWHSLGSYMSNKVSCQRADVIRAMVWVASDGYNWTCTGPVTSLILHLPWDHLASYQWWLNAYRYKSEQNMCSDTEVNTSLGDIKNCVEKTSCSLWNTVTFCNSYSGYWNDPHSWPKDGSDDILDFFHAKV